MIFHSAARSGQDKSVTCYVTRIYESNKENLNFLKLKFIEWSWKLMWAGNSKSLFFRSILRSYYKTWETFFRFGIHPKIFFFSFFPHNKVHCSFLIFLWKIGYFLLPLWNKQLVTYMACIFSRNSDPALFWIKDLSNTPSFFNNIR